jgi:transposase
MEQKLLLRPRVSLVRVRTRIKNKIHAIVDRNRDSYSGLENITDIFGSAGIFIFKDKKIPQPDYMLILGYFDLISDINKKMACLEAEIDKRMAPGKDIELLQTITGVDSFTAFILKSEMDDIEKFSSKEKFTSYGGLIPSVHQSGLKSYIVKTTKQGNKFIRWTLTEAAQVLLRYSKYFIYHYNKLRVEQDGNSAIIAVARRLSEIAYVILEEKREYIEKTIIYS